MYVSDLETADSLKFWDFNTSGTYPPYLPRYSTGNRRPTEPLQIISGWNISSMVTGLANGRSGKHQK
jgi:hypothetical protein